MKKNITLFIILFFLLISLGHSKIKILESKFEAHPLLIKKIEEWINSLQNSSEREESIKKLLKIGNISYKYLIKAFYKKDSLTKSYIVKILTQLKVEKSIPIFIESLKNKQESVRVKVEIAKALGKFPSRKTFDVLIKYSFDSDSRIARTFSYSICRSKTRQAIPYLIELLKHWNRNIKHKAHISLIALTKQNHLSSDYEVWQKWWNNYKDIFEEIK